MPTLSIENVPEQVVDALQQRAARNHRSLQDELLELICPSTDHTSNDAGTTEEEDDPSEWLSIGELTADLARSLRESHSDATRRLGQRRHLTHPDPNQRLIPN